MERQSRDEVDVTLVSMLMSLPRELYPKGEEFNESGRVLEFFIPGQGMTIDALREGKLSYDSIWEVVVSWFP